MYSRLIQPIGLDQWFFGHVMQCFCRHRHSLRYSAKTFEPVHLRSFIFRYSRFSESRQNQIEIESDLLSRSIIRQTSYHWQWLMISITPSVPLTNRKQIPGTSEHHNFYYHNNTYVLSINWIENNQNCQAIFNFLYNIYSRGWISPSLSHSYYPCGCVNSGWRDLSVIHAFPVSDTGDEQWRWLKLSKRCGVRRIGCRPNGPNIFCQFKPETWQTDKTKLKITHDTLIWWGIKFI